MRRRYIQRNGELVEVTHDYRPKERTGPYIQGDIQPYQSMATGEVISSRSHHRAHLRQHGLIEIGNELDAAKRKGDPPKDRHRKEHIAEAMRKQGLM